MASDAGWAEITISWQLRNTGKTDLTMIREPWGDQFKMPPGSSYQIVVRGSDREMMELEIGDNRVTIWAVRNEEIQVFQDGKEVHGS